jgi:hypothetical protein
MRTQSRLSCCSKTLIVLAGFSFVGGLGPFFFGAPDFEQMAMMPPCPMQQWGMPPPPPKPEDDWRRRENDRYDYQDSKYTEEREHRWDDEDRRHLHEQPPQEWN